MRGSHDMCSGPLFVGWFLEFCGLDLGLVRTGQNLGPENYRYCGDPRIPDTLIEAAVLVFDFIKTAPQFFLFANFTVA